MSLIQQDTLIEPTVPAIDSVSESNSIANKNDSGNKDFSLTVEKRSILQSTLDLICASATAKTSATVVYPVEAYDIILSIFKGFPTAQMSCLFMFRLMVLSSTTAGSTEAQTLLGHILEALGKGESAFSGVPAMVMALCVFANLLSTHSGMDIIYYYKTTKNYAY